MTATVAVVGGGYGGVTVAQALDDVADVILIDPKDSFFHNVGALRAVVDPVWTEQIFFSYDTLLKRGQVIRDWAVSVGPKCVRLSSGRRIRADYVVVATGTSYPFPAKASNPHAEAAKRRINSVREGLAEVESVLLLGAGPVGLELAGEILARWPDKTVTIVDPAPDVVWGGFIRGFDDDVADRLRKDLRRELDRIGVELLLGTSLREDVTVPPNEATTFTTVTWSGRPIVADIWFRCHGRQPATRFLSAQLLGARRSDSYLRVTPDLRVLGHQDVFVVGDIGSTGAPDTAVVAIEQGTLVAENIATLIEGGKTLKKYRPSQPLFLIPVGPNGGASYSPDAGILDAETTAAYKGQDLFLGKYAEIFGVERTAGTGADA